MKIKVVYQSFSGHTKRIARTLASALKVEAQNFKKAPSEDSELLFLGGGLYAGSLDKKFANYLQNLSTKHQKVILFSSSASGQRPSKLIKEILINKGYSVDDQELFVKGRFLFLSITHPNKADLQSVKDFALNYVGQD
ncbi:MAG: hypothetical protein LBV55_03195 [Acholeplasmatales bacterium]|jgi:flavodoxin|nr:hypothetical protein [Acholeplasmatales bacterium]